MRGRKEGQGEERAGEGVGEMREDKRDNGRKGHNEELERDRV